MTARKDGHRITFLRLPADLREQVDRAAAEGFRPIRLPAVASDTSCSQLA
jgi:hypothetical protein